MGRGPRKMALPFLPLVLWESVPFGDQDAFLDWQLPHLLAHQALAKATNTPLVLLDDLRTDAFAHADMHHKMARVLGINDLWDFAGYDLTDRASYNDFMLSHAQAHAVLQKAAGL